MTEQEAMEENLIADRIARKIISIAQPPQFPSTEVPVEVAAAVLGRSGTWVIGGIEHGLLPIGAVTRPQNGGKATPYISPKLFWEYTGFLYDPDAPKPQKRRRRKEQ